MKTFTRFVLASVALASVLGASVASAQSPAAPRATSILRGPATSAQAKICFATYDPMPGSSQMHFNATTQCAATFASTIGSPCICPASVNGRAVGAKGHVVSNVAGPAPVVH